MAKSIRAPLKQILTSKLGLVLCVAHTCLFVYAVISEGRFFSAREFPCYDREFSGLIIAGYVLAEKHLLDVLFLLDLPLLAPGALLLNYAVAPYVCLYTKSWLLAAVWLLSGALQWLLVGWLIEWLFWRPRWLK